MWFARLFGGRRADDDDDQPTATPPVPRKRAPKSAVARPAALAQGDSNDKKSKGFDPYDTGTFQSNAWDRVIR